MAGHARLHDRGGARAGGERPALSFEGEQCGDGVPPSRTRLQRLCTLAVRRGRGDGGGWRRQLRRRRPGAVPGKRPRLAIGARVGKLLPLHRHQARDAEEGVHGARSRVLQPGILQHGRARRGLQPRLELYLRRLEQVRRTDGARPVRPSRPGQADDGDQGRQADRSRVDRGDEGAVLHRRRRELGNQPLDAALGGRGLAHAGRHREGPARTRALAARDHGCEESLHRRRRRAELRGQRPARARSRLRERVDSAGGGR